jgi:SET family sugar efflux transporter-like MFS transporter
MTVFVTETMRIDVIWAGIALGVAAGLEIPVLVLIGRLSLRFSSLRLIVTGCLAGIAYYVAMAYVTGPVMLIALQPLNARCFAAIAGVGLTLFQQMIPGPGLSTGLYTNTRRIGAIVSGPIIALGSKTCPWEPWHLPDMLRVGSVRLTPESTRSASPPASRMHERTSRESS